MDVLPNHFTYELYCNYDLLNGLRSGIASPIISITTNHLRVIFFDDQAFCFDSLLIHYYIARKSTPQINEDILIPDWMADRRIHSCFLQSNEGRKKR